MESYTYPINEYLCVVSHDVTSSAKVICVKG